MSFRIYTHYTTELFSYFLRNKKIFPSYLALLDDDAYHPPAAVVDDFLEGVLQLHLAVFGHLADFVFQMTLSQGSPKAIGKH